MRGTFNDEPYQAVQKKVLYDHLAIVKFGRCSRPKCGIVDSAVPNDPETNPKEPATIPKKIADGIEKDLGKLHDAIADMQFTDSNSSITDDIKAKETKETMAESIVVDGVGYTPEMVKKLVYQYDTSNIIGEILSLATGQSRTFTLSVSVPATVQNNDVLQQFSHEVKGFTELETELYDGCMNDFGDYEFCFSPENDPEVFNTLVSPNTAIPEFPTVAIPIVSVLGLMYVMNRRK